MTLEEVEEALEGRFKVHTFLSAWVGAMHLRDRIMDMDYPVRKRFWESIPAFVGMRLGSASLPGYLVVCHVEPEDIARAALYAVQEG